MNGKELLVDPSLYDLDRVVTDLETIRQYNRQRHEFEQLTAIVYEDTEKHICVGYKDVADDEFWVRGHMPGFPLMPGVMMCEAAAQLASYYCSRYDLIGAPTIGLAGLEKVRFRGMVRPGDRLVIASAVIKIRRGYLLSCQFQETVNGQVVCEGQIMGFPLAPDKPPETQQPDSKPASS